MDPARDALPDDIAALKAALIVERANALEVAAELAVARAKASEDLALIAQQKLRIASSSARSTDVGRSAQAPDRSVDADVGGAGSQAPPEDELAAEKAVAKSTNVRGLTRKRPDRNTFPDHLPRERVVIAPPTACACCGGPRLRSSART